MTVRARRERILELIRGKGYLAIEALATQFRVTPQTIRGDLNRLADEGRLVRHHGGASMPSSVINTSYAERHSEFAREKACIAEALAHWLSDRCSLFSCGGVDHEGNLLDYHDSEVAVVRAMLQRARQSVLVLGRERSARISSFLQTLSVGRSSAWLGGRCGLDSIIDTISYLHSTPVTMPYTCGTRFPQRHSPMSDKFPRNEGHRRAAASRLEAESRKS